MVAADLFIKNCVDNVSGESTENYLGKSWFKYIISPVRKWYQKKYGTSALIRKEKELKSAVIYNGVFYTLKIPMRLSIPKGELFEYHFPKEILPFENKWKFILNPPSLLENSQDRMDLESAVQTAVNLTRAISNNIDCATFKNVGCKEFADGIQPHTQKAVEDFLSGDRSRAFISLWEIHLAIEKSMKALLCQKGIQLKFTHDLEALRNDIEPAYPGFIEESEVKQFLNHKEAIECRYGRGKSRKKSEIYDIYIKAMELINKITFKYERKMYLNNAMFLIKPMDWKV